MSIRLLICDDHELIRRGLSDILAGTDIEIVGEAATGKEVLRKAKRLKPDVILLDIRMPAGDGISTLETCQPYQPVRFIYIFLKGVAACRRVRSRN